MSIEFEDCLKKGKIKKFSRGKILVGKELEQALLDLESANKSYQDRDFKWATIKAYYSMFHIGRALLYTKNYRERSHHCLIEALRTLYVEEKLLDYETVEVLQKAKSLREDADYYGDFSQTAAKSLLEKAKIFLDKAKAILG